MGVLRFKGGHELSVHTVAKLAPRLLDLARSRAELRVDLSEVERCDTAGLQLLLLARREAAQHGTRLRYAAPSTPLREFLRFYRCEGLLTDAETGPQA